MSRSGISLTFGLVTVFLAASLASGQSSRVVSTDSVSPENGSGGSQVFTFAFSDSNGYQDLFNGGYHILINTSPNGTNSCWLQIGPDGIRLAPDNPNFGWSLVAYGSSTIAYNSQCAINGPGTTESGSGNTLTLNLSVTFRVAYAGMKTVYTDANSSAQYEPVANYNVTATAPDFTVSVSPSSQSVNSGQSTTYTVTVTALNGFNQDITLSVFPSVNGGDASGVSATLNPSTIMGGNGTSMLTATASASTATSNWTLPITASSPSDAHSTSAQLAVTGSAPPPPPTLSTNSISPQNGSGSSQVFTFGFSDSNGYQSLFNGGYHILINSSPNGTDSCWVQMGPDGVRLAPDDPNNGWSLVAYGSSATASNSQCTINGAGTTESGSGNNLTLSLSVTFPGAYAGTKNIYTDVNSSAPNYVAAGTYDVTATAPDFTLSVAPQSQGVNAGQSTTYTVTATALNGFNQDITLSFGASATGTDSGVTGTFNPAVISGGNGTSTLTVTTSASVPTSNWTLTVNGMTPTVSHTATAQLAVTGATAPPPPTLSTSVSPQNGSGGSQIFTFVFSDSNGYQSLFSGGYHVLINSSPNGTNSCWVQIGPDGVRLAPDNPNNGWALIAYSSSTTAGNSQCIINGPGTTVSGSGNTLTLNLSVTFQAAYAGAKNIYTDVNASSPYYVSAGTYNVAATSPDFTLSTTPSSQTVAAGQSVTYTVTATAVNGFSQNITLSTSAVPQGTSASFNPSVITGGAGTSILTMTASPTAPSTSDGQVWLSGTSSSVSHTNVVNLSVTGAPPPPPPTISTDSVSPQNGSGSSQVFTFMFSDSAGYQDLLGGKYHVLINAAPSGTSSCWALLLSTGLSLAPDDPSQSWTFVPYGSSNTAQNSQCGVSGVGTNISGTGNSLTLSLALTFTAAYDGTRNVYTDVNASAPDYVGVTTYTVQ